jgi:hypothetical protein
MSDGTIKFSRLSLNSVSRFPRDKSENFVDQETLIDFQSGFIYGGYQLASNFTKFIPSAGKSVCVGIQIDENDRLKFSFGKEDTLTNCRAAAKKVDTSNNLVNYDPEFSLIWVCVLSSSDGSNLNSITVDDLVDLRVFANLAAPTTKNLQNKHNSGTVDPRLILFADAVAAQTTLNVCGNLKFNRNEKISVKSNTEGFSTVIEQSLINLSDGSYSVRPISESASSKALRKSNGADWSLGVDYNYGDDLKTVPLSGNKLYGSIDGITLYNDSDGVEGGVGGRDLSLLIPDLKFYARNLSSYSSYIPLNREVAIDPEAGIIKFGSDFNFGDGRDGNITLSTPGTYSLNQSINGSTYCRSRKVSSLVKKSSRVISYTGSDLSLSAGDVVIIFTAQVAESVSKVGNYSVLKVQTASANQITVSENISHGQVGVAFEFDGVTDNVFVMTVPQFNNVSIGTGVTLTCDDFSYTDGFGVLAFIAKGTVQTSGTGKISADGKGYRGATVHGGAGQSWLLSTYNEVRQTIVDTGGAGGSFGLNGVDGVAGTQSISGNFVAIAGDGGGSGGTGGGGGGGGGYSNLGGTGSVGGVAGAGGGGGGATSIGVSLPSGTSSDGGIGDSGSNGTSGSTGGTGGFGLSAGYTANGGIGGALASSRSDGGQGGLTVGSPDVPNPLFGGGGGAAGRGGHGGTGKFPGGVSDSSAGGSGGGSIAGSSSSGVSSGGNGGGLVLILADQFSNIVITANGAAGDAGANGIVGGSSSAGNVSGSSNPLSGQGLGGHGAGGSSGGGGGGGGGAGGTILLFSRYVTGSFSINALGGAGGSGGTAASGASASAGAINAYASAGGGGQGGAGTAGSSGGNGSDGRIRLNYFYYSGLYPAAGEGASAWLASSPSGFLGKIPRIDENIYIRGSFNFYNENTDFDTKSELCEVESYTNKIFGSTDVAVTEITLKNPLKLTHRCINAAAVYRNKQSVSVDALLEKYNSRIIFDSGLLPAFSGGQVTGIKHGVNLSLNQFTPMVFIYLSDNFSSYDRSNINEIHSGFISSNFVNDNEVVGVFLDIQENTLSITTGASGLYYLVNTNIYITNGFIRILFVRN